MKRIYYLLLCSILCWGTATAGRRVVNLKDHGILPGTDSRDLCSRLRNVIETVTGENTNGDDIVLKFKRGRYDFHAADAEHLELYISNHDQNQPKVVGICLRDLKNVTLDGCGSDFIFHGRMLPIAMIGTLNCTVRRLSIDFADPQITQVEIVDNDPNAGITFRVSDYVKYRIADNGRFESYGDDWAIQPASGIAFEGATRHIVYNTSDLGINTSDVKPVGDRTLQAPAWRDSRLPVGTRVAMRGWGRPHPGIFLDACTNTSISDVKVHYAEGMGLLAQRSTDITLHKFRVCLRGKNDPRYFTTQADATHFSQCRGKIISEKGLYEGMMDDAINVHGIYLRVRERIDDHTLRCRFEHDQAWGFAWGDAGDTVSFIRSATMENTGTPNVISDIRPVNQASVTGCREFIIQFKQPVPAAVSADEGYGVENLTWTPEVEFRDNIVRNNRARGALFSSPRRTVCERNLFDHTSGTAILLCGDCNGWYESGAVRDLVIRKNRFVNALTSMFQFTNAIISIYPEIPNLPAQRQYFHGGHPGAITIVDNEFDTFDRPLLYAKSVDGLVFKENKVKTNTDYKPFHPNQKPVLLEHCKDAVIPGYVERPSTFVRIK